MKFDTIIIGLIVFVIGFAFFLAQEDEKNRSFFNTVQLIIGLKEPDNQPKPEDTLVAPFADADVKPLSAAERAHASLPVNKVPLNMPHRTSRYVAEWLVQHAGNALLLDRDRIENINTTVAPSFTPTSLKQYKDFGNKTQIFSTVYHNEDTSLTTYMTEPPELISAGPVGGVYEWRFEMMMVLNLVKGTLENYNRGNNVEQQNKNVYFCITAQRNNDANEEGLLISEWASGRCR